MALITTQELLDYLGTEEENLTDVESARNAAIERLNRATGVNWEIQERQEIANEVIKSMAYLHFYGIRDGLKNTDFIRQHIIELIKTLQFSEEATGDGTS